jgi:pyridoxamine 5'-phosphate oxidase
VDERELTADPLIELGAWVREAGASVDGADAMTLATATPDGRVSARIVLLRGIDERGLTFFTNRESRKGLELRDNPRAALVLHWWGLGRQARVEGEVVTVEDAESDAYWASRPRASRIAASISNQSRPLASRDELDRLFAETSAALGDEDVPRPPHWGGYRVVPDAIELWTHRDDRLHDRIRYERTASGWRSERLAP